MDSSRTLLIALIALTGTAFFPTHDVRQSPSEPAVKARLSAEKSTIEEGGSIDIRFEIENVSDHILLVGRDPQLVTNWPFSISLLLDDPSGKEAHRFSTGYLDPQQMADFATKKGVLEWWMPLTPHTFMGKYFPIPLVGVPPGRYQLKVKYRSVRPHTPSELTPEQRSITSQFSIFDGSVETNPIWFEIVPK
jgi:hypothetical protein